MKRVAIFFILLVSLSLISSVEFNLKNEFKKGETLITKVSGNFVDPILRENVVFYRGHVRIPLEFDITKIEDEFYIYAVLPESETQENHSISIEGVRYYKGSKLVDENLVGNFTIINETVDFSISPGVINSNNDFIIEVQNLKDFKINIGISVQTIKGSESSFSSLLFGDLIEGSQNNLQLKSGEKQKINFLVDNIFETTFKDIEFSAENTVYNIPAYILINSTEPIKDKRSLKFDSSDIDLIMPTNSDTRRTIYILNNGKEDLFDIDLSFSSSLDPYLSLSDFEISELRANSSFGIEAFFVSEDVEDYAEGRIIARARTQNSSEWDVSDELDVFLEIRADYIPPPEVISPSDPIRESNCDELDGDICSSDQECSQDTIKAKDGWCCQEPGVCKAKEPSSVGTIIGWGLLVVIVIVLLWFFKKKYKGAKGPPSLLDRAKGRKK